MDDIILSNSDAGVGIKIKQDLINLMYTICEKSHPNETGGILIGQYSPDYKYASILKITDAPEDSKKGRLWFHRGTQGLQELLHKLWKSKGIYYLGEWHYHPGGRPIPSIQDLSEMKLISSHKDYNCPEPILIIVGGSPKNFNIGAYVYPGENLTY